MLLLYLHDVYPVWLSTKHSLAAACDFSTSSFSWPPGVTIPTTRSENVRGVLPDPKRGSSGEHPFGLILGTPPNKNLTAGSLGKWFVLFPCSVHLQTSRGSIPQHVQVLKWLHVHHGNPRESFIFNGYDPYFEGLKPSLFMVLGSKGRGVSIYTRLVTKILMSLKKKHRFPYSKSSISSVDNVYSHHHLNVNKLYQEVYGKFMSSNLVFSLVCGSSDEKKSAPALTAASW